MTVVKVLKWTIALAPPVTSAYEAFKSSGNVGFAAGDLVASYTGYNMFSKDFALNRMATGYIPLFGAWLFGKVASRVLR